MVAHVSTAVIVISGRLNGLTDGMPYNWLCSDVTGITKITEEEKGNNIFFIIQLRSGSRG